ncbi:predicted protein [Naegleria gruberi]|uniref:Predicted protein n=1 Tax=Naegleria gruberi TaxID=5762 RepID=D2W032_NAEGR|nr:uncharacterized protein NAEGRDRAFT_74714 [Naegleria gruberi]EFC37502.1 predicted protein [Naegleria gruberi]|eukprot:XP_002670246.1 predicted protein [Naegleria gruberi strain NEG-M]
MNVKHKYPCTHCKSEVYFQPSSTMASNSAALDDGFVFITSNDGGGGQTPTNNTTSLNIECNHSGKIERIEDIEYLTEDILSSITIGEDLKKNTKLSTLINDLYLCNTCMTDLFGGLSEEIEQLELECKLYDEKLKKSKKFDTNGMYKKYMKEMDELRNEELVLREQVNVIQNDRHRIGRNITSLQTEYNTQQESEKNYWKIYFQFIHNNQFLAEENRRKSQLIDKEDKIRRKSPLAGMFHLWYEGSYGTINGLRMGRLRHDPVSWEEINAAWGLAVLLLDLTAQQLNNFKFTKYKLVPKASCSSIKELESGDKYDLFFSSTRNIQSFNEGMKCFLFCLEELCQHIGIVVPGSSIGTRLIVKADEGKIQDLSMLYSVEREYEWTKALKYLIINLKFVQKNVIK